MSTKFYVREGDKDYRLPDLQACKKFIQDNHGKETMQIVEKSGKWYTLNRKERIYNIADVAEHHAEMFAAPIPDLPPETDDKGRLTLFGFTKVLSEAGHIKPAEMTYTDGEAMATKWVGKTIEDLYAEQEKKIAEVVEDLKKRTFAGKKEDLQDLHTHLTKFIDAFEKDKVVFKDHPEFDKRITEVYLQAAVQLKPLLEIVNDKIDFLKWENSKHTK